MLEEAFAVATEFRFDVGQAVLNTNALTNAVDKLSTTADNALGSLSYLAGGLTAHLGLGSGGLLSVLTEAFRLSEEFHQGSLGFMNSIGANMNVLSGHIHGFNEQLETSKQLMDDVSDVANGLGLGSAALAKMTQLLSTPLAQRGKVGQNFSVGIQLAKNAMITGEATGIGGAGVGEALLRGLSPGGSIGGKLFERLVNTQAFQTAGIRRPQQLGNMNQDKKIDLLVKSMGELGNNAGYLAERLNSIGTAFNVLKGQVGNILKPIGDALRVPVLTMIKRATEILKVNGPAFGKSIATLLNSFMGDPEKMLVNLMTLRHFKEDMHKALSFTEFALLFGFLQRFASGKILGYLTTGLRYFASAIWDIAAAVIAILPIGKIFMFLIKQIGYAFEFIGVFAASMIVFQGLSKGAAQAHVSDAKDLLALSPRIAAFMVRFNNAIQMILTPITLGIQGIADLTEWFFKWSNYVKIGLWAGEYLNDVLEVLGKASYLAMTGLSGLTNIIIGFVADIIALKNPLKGIVTNFNEGTETFMQQHPYLSGGDKVASKAVVNNYNHVEARFDMREQLEPDRIAFAVTEHLKKLTINATQGRGNSLQGAFAGQTTPGSR